MMTGPSDSGYIAVQLHTLLPRPTSAFPRSLPEPNDPAWVKPLRYPCGYFQEYIQSHLRLFLL
jgi:hypothetical protein